MAVADAVTALSGGDLVRAFDLVSQILAEHPGDPEAWQVLAAIQFRRRQFDLALASYERALALAPNDAALWYNRAQALKETGRLDEALASMDMALSRNEEFPEAWNNRGAVLALLGRLDQAVESFRRGLALDGASLSAHYNLAMVLGQLSRFEEALAHYDKAAALAPGRADIHGGRGMILRKLKLYSQALESFDRALALAPAVADGHKMRGEVLLAMGRALEAAQSFARALSLQPDNAGYAHLCGEALEQAHQFRRAITFYEKALALSPGFLPSLNGLAACALGACDWKRAAALRTEILRHIADDSAVFAPFVLLGYDIPADLMLKATDSYLKHEFGEVSGRTSPLIADVAKPGGGRDRTPRATSPGGGKAVTSGTEMPKLRLGYLSADFCSHATAALITEIIEGHDRAHFHVAGFSYGRDDGSEARRCLVAAFDTFYEIGAMTDQAAAEFIRDREIDIAIDLKGHTRDARPGILMRRPAPVQLTYLGYPATVGHCGIDFVLADKIVLPLPEQEHYAERIWHLPGSYQANSARAASSRPRRAQAGLPEDSFVFCCFNHSWKISEPIFKAWMRILLAVPQSVLWLLQGDARENLTDGARRNGVDPARLIFAEPVAQADHIARLALADLFLDTLPYNAHTTASDALFAGVPVLSLKGDSFAGRVGASLLAALEMEELIAKGIDLYEAMACRLATEAGLSAALRQKLAANRSSLFDAASFCGKIEKAYRDIWGRGGGSL